MKHKKVILSILLVIVLIVIGYFKVAKEMKPATEKLNKDLSALEVKKRDARRTADIKILSLAIQIYALDKEKLPVKKDSKGNFVSYKLLSGSSDFNELESILNGNNPEQHAKSDPSPDRYYEYYSDGKVYSVKGWLEQENIQNCKLIKPEYCEFEVKGDLATILKE
ncbi:MAG: hypothetical protein WCO55_05515 [Candidatus Falkowbacteria bacterium]